ncbi:MAG: hypothetical protein J6039_03005 [Alphaproteobacteria bacterium]|nr:hypothetical protein [Alphaproteobacteria bacterium]
MVGRMTKNIIEVRQGDSFTITLHLYKNGANIDLDGSVVRMQVRRNSGSLVWELCATSWQDNQGKMLLQITPEYSNIAVGDYKCDIQLETPDGSINTIFPSNIHQIGIFRITEQVTQGE